MKSKILKSIDFNAVTPLNDQEMSLLVGGRGGGDVIAKVLIAILRGILGGGSNRNCDCTNTNCLR